MALPFFCSRQFSNSLSRTKHKRRHSENWDELKFSAFLFIPPLRTQRQKHLINRIKLLKSFLKPLLIFYQERNHLKKQKIKDLVKLYSFRVGYAKFCHGKKSRQQKKKKVKIKERKIMDR